MDRIVVCVVAALVAVACDGVGVVERANVADRSEPSASPISESESEATPEVKPARRLKPSEWVIGPKKGVTLVFSGATSADHIRDLISELDGRPAAFALSGRYARRHGPLVGEIMSAGSSVINHGWSGEELTSMSSKRLARSLKRSDRTLIEAGAEPRPFLLPPRNQRGKRVARIAGRKGYGLVRPSVLAPKGGPKTIARVVARKVRPGAIVGLRLGRQQHRAAGGRLIDRLEADGLSLIPIRRLERTRPVRWDLDVAPGWKGPHVRRLQKRLLASTYPAGEVDGVFGQATAHAVLAFEKVHGLERDAIVDPRQMVQILLSEPPPAPPGKAGHFLDIDLTRQVLFEVKDGRVINTFPISSANGETYRSSGGGLAVARTPRGSFEADRKIPGWRTSYLGQLYYPIYFFGGYAIHGSASVPAYPASHGCVRVPMHVAQDLYSRLPLGAPITVHD